MQSALTYSLVSQLPLLDSLGVDIVRVSPQAHGTMDVIRHIYRAINGQADIKIASKAVENFMPVGPCDGYFYAKPGMASEPGAGI